MSLEMEQRTGLMSLKMEQRDRSVCPKDRLHVLKGLQSGL